MDLTEEQKKRTIATLADQGYVPRTCTLDPMLAFILVMSEVQKGHSPCWGCNMNREVCKGQPKHGSQV